MGKIKRTLFASAVALGFLAAADAATNTGTYLVPKKKKNKSKYTRNKPKRK